MQLFRNLLLLASAAALNAQTPPPVTRILATLTVKEGFTPDQFAKVMPGEVRSTVQLYLDGKIEQWWARGDGKGVVFLLDCKSVEEAKALMDSLPLSKGHFGTFEYMPLGPLTPLAHPDAPRRCRPVMELECVCANTRRAARLVTQVYSHQMGSSIEPSQFLLLSALDRKPGIAQVLLSEALGYDKTTLSRSLRLMQKNGWLRLMKVADRRERGFELTPAGKKLLSATEPRWQRAQSQVRQRMTAEEWTAVSKAFAILTRVATELRSASEPTDTRIPTCAETASSR